MKYFYALILMTWFGLNLFGQQSENKSDIREIRKNNYQVDLGFRSVQSIYNNTAAATLLFKKKFSSGELIDVTSVSFLRTYFTLNSRIRLDNDSIPKRQLDFDSQTTIDATLGFGIEKQFQNRRFVHYFGGDIFTNYYDGGRIQSYAYSNFLTNFNYDVLYQREKSINPGIIPFFGLKYYLTDQLNFGIETGFSLSYYHATYSKVQYSLATTNNQEVYSEKNFIPFTKTGVRFNFLGLRFITLGYSFK